MMLWIVGVVIHPNEWAFAGVFDSEAKAIRACKSPLHFVGPARLNYTVPAETVEWPGCYFPLHEKQAPV